MNRRAGFFVKLGGTELREVACEVAREVTREVARFVYEVVREVACEVENPHPKTSREVDVKLFSYWFSIRTNFTLTSRPTSQQTSREVLEVILLTSRATSRTTSHSSIRPIFVDVSNLKY